MSDVTFTVCMALFPWNFSLMATNGLACTPSPNRNAQSLHHVRALLHMPAPLQIPHLQSIKVNLQDTIADEETGDCPRSGALIQVSLENKSRCITSWQAEALQQPAVMQYELTGQQRGWALEDKQHRGPGT